MTFQQLLWMHVGGFVILLAAVTTMLRCLCRSPFASSFGVAYFLFIIIAACLYFPGSKDAQSELYWLIPSMLTIPASLLLLVARPGSALGAAILLAILGTLQYWGIGLLIDWLLQKRNMRDHCRVHNEAE